MAERVQNIGKLIQPSIRNPMIYKARDIPSKIKIKNDTISYSGEVYLLVSN